MRHLSLALLAAGTLLIVGTSRLHAQEAAVGAAAEVIETPPYSDAQTVEASILNPGAAELMAINVEFSGSGDELTGAITVPGMSLRVELIDLLITDDDFRFSFIGVGDGMIFECTLNRLDDDSFRGDCFDDEGTLVRMTIGAFEE